MKKNDVIVWAKRLSEAIHRQQEAMSPDSNGKGHGKLLRAIEEHPGISGVELALLMNVAPPVISEKLTGLEKDGIIVRERDENDRRRMHIYITSEGTMALARRAEGRRRFEESIVDCLSSEEQDLFCSMCERILQSIKEMEQEDQTHASDEGYINLYDIQRERKRRKMQTAEKQEKV